MIGRDFTYLGRLRWRDRWADGTDPDAYNALLRDNFSPAYPLQIWSYPPHLLLFTAAGVHALHGGLCSYCVLGLILYVTVVADGEQRWDHIALLALAPAVTLNI